MRKNRMSNHLYGYGLIVLSSVLFGSYGIWSKLMGGHFDIYYQAWTRGLFLAIVLLPFLIWKKLFKRIKKQDLKWFYLYLAATIFTQVPLYYAYVHTGVATAALLYYAMFIIASYIVGHFIVGEALTKVKFVALCMALLGLGLVFHTSVVIFSAIGLVLAGVNGLASGTEVSTTKNLTTKYPSILLIFYSWVIIFLTHLPLSLLVGEKQLLPTLTFPWMIAALYAIVSLLSFWLVVEGFRRVDASTGSLVGLIEIIWAVLFGVIFFQEKIPPVFIAGGTLIVLAGMLPDAIDILNRRKNR